MNGSERNLVQVENLTVSFSLARTSPFRLPPTFRAVDGVSFSLQAGETLAVVGESGSGKSTTVRALLRLIEAESGRVVVDGEDWMALSRRELRRRRRKIQMVFQDPYASLDPSMTVGQSIAQPLRTHLDLTKDELRTRVYDLLGRVGLDPSHAARYPHEFSGGQRQRIAIARAIAPEPAVVVCDEAVSALDVSTQNQILNLLKDIQDESGISILFIAHDLSVVHHVADRVAVMYLGEIVESGPIDTVFERPSHPYTRALLAAVPVLDPAVQRTRGRARVVGEASRPGAGGCSYVPRCPERMERCESVAPGVHEPTTSVAVRCHLFDGSAPRTEPVADDGVDAPATSRR